MPTDGEQDKDAELSRASAELDHTRERFVVSMSALEGEVTRTLDWRQWVRRKPGLAVALAFSLGFLLGHRS